MRTSTAVFLVLFLCLYSSREHGSKLRAVASELKGAVHDLTGGSRSSCGEVADTAEVRGLRSQLSDIERRESAAKKTLRTVDRAIRSLEDRVRKLQKDARSDSRYSESYTSGLSLLLHQKAELEAERSEIETLQETLKSSVIRLQAEIDLASIRADRREVEAFLNRERGSPIDRLAGGSHFEGE